MNDSSSPDGRGLPAYCKGDLIPNDLSWVQRYVQIDRLVFMSSNRGIGSSDIDVYCVTSDGRGEVHCFFNPSGRWTELFIDSVRDLNTKLDQADEIAVNFLLELGPAYVRNDKVFEGLVARARSIASSWHMPSERLIRVQYRLRVLASKLSKASNSVAGQATLGMILGAMRMPVMQLNFHRLGVLPRSPSRWAEQLLQVLPPSEATALCRFLTGAMPVAQVLHIVDDLTSDLVVLSMTDLPAGRLTSIT